MSLTNAPLLAAGEIGDWMEFVILLAIVGMSVLGSAAKWLIKQFGGQAPDQTPEPSRTRRPQQPRPTARPTVPPPAWTKPAPARPVVQAPRIEPGTSAVRPRSPAIRRHPAPVQPPRPRPIEMVGPALTPQDVREPALASGHPSTLGTVAQRHLDPYDSPIDERHMDVATPSEAVIHPSTEPEHAGTAAEHNTLKELGLSTHPSVTALRRAIVMSEILGPPLALRSDEQQI